jgi:hypothetical protein
VRVPIGILVLVIGVATPMAMLFWLNGKLSRKPPPSPREVGVLLALNGILPLGLIVIGLGLLLPRLWNAPAFLGIVVVSWLATCVLLAIVGGQARSARRARGENGR